MRLLRSRLGGLPRPFWVLCAGTLANRAGYLVEPFLARYLSSARGRGTRLLAHGPAVLWLTCAGACAAAACGQLALGPPIRRRQRLALAEAQLSAVTG